MGDYHRQNYPSTTPSQDEIWDLTRELEAERNKVHQFEAQLSKKNDILREMTHLQEELYWNLEELQGRISDIQKDKVQAEDAQKKMKKELDHANKAQRNALANLETITKKYENLKQKFNALVTEQGKRKRNKQLSKEPPQEPEQEVVRSTDRYTEEQYLSEIDSLAKENQLLDHKVRDLELIIDGLRKQPGKRQPEHQPSDDNREMLLMNISRLIADCENLSHLPDNQQIWTWVQKLVADYFKTKQDNIDLNEVMNRLQSKLRIHNPKDLPIEVAKLIAESEELRSFVGRAKIKFGLSSSASIADIDIRINSIK